MMVQLSVVAPTAGDRAVFHITDIQFGTSIDNTTWRNAQGTKGYGANILGMAEHLDITKVYDVNYIKSDNIKGHMQRDRIVVDFGHVTNAGQ